MNREPTFQFGEEDILEDYRAWVNYRRTRRKRRWRAAAQLAAAIIYSLTIAGLVLLAWHLAGLVLG